jgi:hypothetical protein
MAKTYQFQKLTVSMRDLGSTGFTHDPEITKGFLAHTYVFDSAKASEDAKESGLTIDQSLTFELAKGFQCNPLDSPSLAMLAIKHSQIHVCICGKKSKVEARWLASLPGFDDYGKDIIRPGAIPFVFWNGQYCFRVHDIERFPRGSQYAIQDFGSLIGTLTSGCKKDEFDWVRNDANRYVEYSAISHNNEIVLRKRGESLTITQAFLQLLDKKAE